MWFLMWLFTFHNIRPPFFWKSIFSFMERISHMYLLTYIFRNWKLLHRNASIVVAHNFSGDTVTVSIAIDSISNCVSMWYAKRDISWKFSNFFFFISCCWSLYDQNEQWTNITGIHTEHMFLCAWNDPNEWDFSSHVSENTVNRS